MSPNPMSDELLVPAARLNSGAAPWHAYPTSKGLVLRETYIRKDVRQITGNLSKEFRAGIQVSPPAHAVKMGNDLYEKIKTVAIDHIRAFESPKPFDAEAIYQYRTPDCVMYFHPENSMPAPFGGGVTITKKEHVPALNMLRAVTSKLKFDIKEVTVDVKTRIVTARMHGIFDFKAVGEDPEVKDWMIEYIWITEHDEDSGLIVRLEESLDVVTVLPMLDKAGRYAKEHA